MRTLIQLVFSLIIAFSIVSCGGDANSTEIKDKTSASEDNSTKPVPTFKMAHDKNDTKKNGADKKVSNKPQVPVTTPTVTNENKLNASGLTDGQILNSVPSACALVSAEDIAKIVGVPASEIVQNDASHTRSPFTRSCFFRWDGASPNTGILVQVQANPVAEEYAEWVTLFVSSKRTSGEKTMGTNETFKYEKMEGLGDDGSYSHRLGKYVWRDGNKYAFMIAFNTNSAKELQMKNAKAIGNIMMKNYRK